MKISFGSGFRQVFQLAKQACATKIGQKYQEKLMLMKTHEKLDNKNQRGSESVVYFKVLINLSN